MKNAVMYAASLMAASFCLQAQAKRPARLAGTVVAIRTEPFEIQVKDDVGKQTAAKLDAGTQFCSVEPGERDLRNAKPLQVSGVSPGDRVLITLAADGVTARRVIVMPARSIATRQEADQADWRSRGVAGVVESRKDGTIVVRRHSIIGESLATVVVDGNTVFRRYAPGSVKFADAKVSDFNSVARGDQLRARGAKSADGATVKAEEVVFGTFLSRAGKVVRVDAAAGEILIRNNFDDKLLTVRITPDSQLKKMVAMPLGDGAPGGPGMGGAPGPMPPGDRAGGAADFMRMIEHLPAARIGEIQPGEMIVVSSTRQARPDQLTAIMLLSNAESLVRMASMRAAAADRAGNTNGNRGMQQGADLSLGGVGNALGGIDLPGMLQQ